MQVSLKKTVFIKAFLAAGFKNQAPCCLLKDIDEFVKMNRKTVSELYIFSKNFR